MTYQSNLLSFKELVCMKEDLLVWCDLKPSSLLSGVKL